MSYNVHTLRIADGSSTNRLDSLGLKFMSQVAYLGGNGDPSAIAAGTPGAGYQTIPTVAYANKGSGASATAVANMGVVSATVAAGGTGYTNGAQTLTGVSGTGTKFQAAVTVAGGVVTSVNSITVAGVYTAMPTLSGEATTGGGGTGATLNLSMGVVSYTASYGSSNHQYPQGTTATLTGGTPTTAAVPGAVTVASVAGQGSTIAVTGLTLPPKYCFLPGDMGQAGDSYLTNRTQSGFTINIVPALTTQVLAAGSLDYALLY